MLFFKRIDCLRDIRICFIKTLDESRLFAKEFAPQDVNY